MDKFDIIYNNLKLKVGNTAEKIRRREIREITITILTLILTILGLFFILIIFNILTIYISKKTTAIFGGLYIFFLICVCVIWSFRTGKSKKNNMPNVRYCEIYKEKIIKELIKEYNSNLKYFPNEGITEAIYSQGFSEKYDEFYSKDLIIGKLENGNTINISKVLAVKTATVDEDGSDSLYNSTYNGICAIVDLNKTYANKIIIKKNKLLQLSKDDKIEMDSNEFEKIYDLYTEDKIGAMQLISSEIMDMLIEFNKNNHITPELIIYHNRLYIRFDVYNIFNSKLLKNSLNKDRLYYDYRIIDSIYTLTCKIVGNIIQTLEINGELSRNVIKNQEITTHEEKMRNKDERLYTLRELFPKSAKQIKIEFYIFLSIFIVILFFCLKVVAFSFKHYPSISIFFIISIISTIIGAIIWLVKNNKK